MKKVTLELTQEQLQKIKDAGILNESEWFEPKEGKYWYLDENSIGSYESDYDFMDKGIFLRQPVYRTKEEAEKADQWRIAYTAVQKYIATNMPFTPDWEDEGQKKWVLYYDYRGKEFDMNWSIFLQHKVLNLYVKSEEDCKKLIKDMQSELRIMWDV